MRRTAFKLLSAAGLLALAWMPPASSEAEPWDCSCRTCLSVNPPALCRDNYTGQETSCSSFVTAHCIEIHPGPKS